MSEWRDRKPGTMGTGDTKAPTGIEGEAKKLREKAEGWTSNSFDASLFQNGGVDPSYNYPDSYNDESGPAWPSHSKDRK